MNHIRHNPNKRIPFKRVLETLLTESATNWPEFLAVINQIGFDKEHKIIGLRAKEREMSEYGRYFSLMSWKLREYFVMTEYLLKIHVVPLFKGLTMADDQTTLTKKMVINSGGQVTL